MKDQLKIFLGNSNPKLGKKICQALGVKPADALAGKFPEGEVRVKINDNVRGADVFIVQSICPPTNDNLVELLVMMDAIKRASAKRITAVIPYFGYARQDRKDQPRVPITAKLVANLIVTSGADRVLAMDLHAAQIQGFFDIPTDHLFSNPVFHDYLSQHEFKDPVAIADIGSTKMVRAFAKKFHAPLAVMDKRRPAANQAEVLNIIGEVKGKNAIFRDVMGFSMSNRIIYVYGAGDNGVHGVAGISFMEEYLAGVYFRQGTGHKNIMNLGSR